LIKNHNLTYPAYEMFCIKRRFQWCEVRPPWVQRVLCTRASYLGTPLKRAVSATVH